MYKLIVLLCALGVSTSILAQEDRLIFPDDFYMSELIHKSNEVNGVLWTDFCIKRGDVAEILANSIIDDLPGMISNVKDVFRGIYGDLPHHVMIDIERVVRDAHRKPEDVVKFKNMVVVRCVMM